MTMAKTSENMFYHLRLRIDRARGHNCGRDHFSIYTQSVSSSSSEETSQSPSPIRSPRVQRKFSINLKQTRNLLFQEVPKTNKGHTPPGSMTELFSRGPFQSQHTETTHIPTMVDHEPKFGEHSRDQEQTRNDK